MATRSKLAVILHADVVDSTALVQKDERLAHDRIRDGFRRFSEIITVYGGTTRELRGDALLAEFKRASDAVSSALAFQADNAEHNIAFDDEIRPVVRVGISLGEVVIADDTLTGSDVVLAQRLEQLADPGAVCVSQAVSQSIPHRLPFDYNDLGDQDVKGFAEPIRAYGVTLREGEKIPSPEPESSESSVEASIAYRKRRRVVATVAVTLIALAGAFLWWQQWKPEFAPASVEEMAFPLPDEPSIAVLPFNNYSDDPKLEFFADGLTEDLTSALSKAHGLFVISRNTSSTYKGKPVNVKRVSEELGVQYVLEGSVQKANGQLRISAQLIDALAGHHLWATRFDRPESDIFALQDEIARLVFVELQVQLTEGDHARVAARGTTNLEAWLLRVEAYVEFIKFEREANFRSRELYKAASETDPNWGRPLAGIAFTHWMDARKGWSASREESIRLGMESAERAIALDANEPLGYMSLGNLHMLIGDHTRGIELRRKAIDLAPNNFVALAGLAMRLKQLGYEQEAVELFERAIRLSPRHPWWVPRGYGTALHVVGRKQEAVDWLQKANSQNAKRVSIHMRLAAVYVDLDRMDEARAEAKEILRLDPKFTISDFLYKGYSFHDPKRNDWYIDLLVRAGLPK
jgi:adenylate cyclase